MEIYSQPFLDGGGLSQPEEHKSQDSSDVL